MTWPIQWRELWEWAHQPVAKQSIWGTESRNIYGKLSHMKSLLIFYLQKTSVKQYGKPAQWIMAARSFPWFTDIRQGCSVFQTLHSAHRIDDKQCHPKRWVNTNMYTTPWCKNIGLVLETGGRPCHGPLERVGRGEIPCQKTQTWAGNRATPGWCLHTFPKQSLQGYD